VNALLQQALREVEALSEADQESIAAVILEELKAEREWDGMMARSQPKLRELARRARAEIREKGSLPYDPSNRPE
jgi:hypothetical protein